MDNFDKFGQLPGPPPKRPGAKTLVDAPAQPRANYTAPSAVNTSVVVVRNMQKELISFHTDLQNSVFKKGTVSFRKDANPFLKYMLDNYAKQSGVEVTQYNANDPGSVASGRSQDDASWKGSYAWSMNQILDSLNKVGQHSQQGENKPDGHWGILTNTALKNVAAFSYSMFELAKDIKLSDMILTQNDVDTFKKMIPENPKDPNAVVTDVSGAAKLTEILKKIRAAWKAFNEKVFRSGELGKETMQTIGFPAKIMQQSQDVSLEEDLKKIYEMHVHDPNYPKDRSGPIFPNQRFNATQERVAGQIQSNEGGGISKPLNITVKDLSSMENFKSFLQTNNVKLNGKPAVADLPGIIAKVKAKIMGTK